MPRSSRLGILFVHLRGKYNFYNLIACAKSHRQVKEACAGGNNRMCIGHLMMAVESMFPQRNSREDRRRKELSGMGMTG